MADDEHTISGPHFHVTRGGYGSGVPYERFCLTGQQLHDQDEFDANMADLFKEQPPERMRALEKSLGIDPSAPVVPPHLDL